LEGKLPFVEMIYTDEKNEHKAEISDSRVDIDVQMVHSRKVRIRATVDTQLSIDMQEVEEFDSEVEGEKSLYKKEKQMDILQLHSIKKDTFRVKEELHLPGTKESIGMLLWQDVANRKCDIRLAVDEILLQGELLVFCFYESPDGKIDWVEQLVHYQGNLPCAGIDEAMYHYAKVELDDVQIDVREDEDGEMRNIGVEGTLKLDIAVYREEQVEILEDAYALNANCVPEKREVRFQRLLMKNQSKCKVMERLVIPELSQEVLQICHHMGSVQISRKERREDGIYLDGALYIGFLYVKADDAKPFEVWRGVVPFSHLLECLGVDEKTEYQVRSSLEQLSVSLQGGSEIEVKAVLGFSGFFQKQESVDMIQTVTVVPLSLEEMEKRPSIVGYTVKKEDTLWELAKRYSTTMEAIMEVNELTDERLKPGSKLLIFKENMSIL
jgi:LysM repeat protein